MRKVLLAFLVVILSVSIVFMGCGEAELGAKPTIKISDLNWGSAHFQSAVAKIIIEEGYGYPVELVFGTTIPLFTGLCAGDLDVFLEGWLANQKEAYDKAMAAGEIELLGILNEDNWQSQFVVPTYVIKGDTARGIEPMAPDLKTVSDLKDPKYVKLFENLENPGKGGLLACMPGSECEKISTAQLKTYGLDEYYDLINPGSFDSMFAYYKSQYDKGKPWLGYLWGPTWIDGLLDLTLLEEPPYDEEVWNENHGCAYPSVKLFIAGHTGFSDKAPDLAEMFGKWEMTSAILAEALAYMYDTEGEPADAAIWFLKNREEVWTKWVPADVAAKVKAAVVEM